MDADPFHPGEREAQARAGVQLRGVAIRDWMPDQHRLFFAGLPVLFAAVAGRAGWPMATVLTGPPGFVSSPDPRTLCVAALSRGRAWPSRASWWSGLTVSTLPAAP